MKKSREEIQQLLSALSDAADVVRANPENCADFHAKSAEFIDALMEYPAPESPTVEEEVKTLRNNPVSEDSSHLSDEAYPVYVMRYALSKLRIPISIENVGGSFDRWSDRWAEIVLKRDDLT